MIVNDRITDYIRSLESSQGSLLDSIEQEAEPGGSPETGPYIGDRNRCGILFSSHVPCDAGKLPHHHH